MSATAFTRKTLLFSNYVNLFGYSLFSPLYAIFAHLVSTNLFLIAGSSGIYALTAGILILLCGRYEDRMNTKAAVVTGYFLLAIGAFLFTTVTTITQLYFVQIFNAVGIGIVTPAWKAVYSKAEDDGQEAKEWSFFDGGDMLITGVASFLGGYAVYLYGFKTVFYLIASIQFVAAAVSLQILRKHPGNK